MPGRKVSASKIDWATQGPIVLSMMQNKSATEVSELTGIKATTIYEFCRRQGVKKTRRHRYKNRLVESSDITLIKQLYAGGMSVREIAEKWECHKDTIYRYLRGEFS